MKGGEGSHFNPSPLKTVRFVSGKGGKRAPETHLVKGEGLLHGILLRISLQNKLFCVCDGRPLPGNGLNRIWQGSPETHSVEGKG